MRPKNRPSALPCLKTAHDCDSKRSPPSLSGLHGQQVLCLESSQLRLRIGLRVVRTSPTKRNWDEVMLNSLDTSAIHGNFQKLPYPNHPQHKHPETAQHAKITWSFGILHSQPKRRSCTCRRPGSFTDREIHCKMCTSKMFTILQSCKMIKKNWKRVVFLGDCIQKHCTTPLWIPRAPHLYPSACEVESYQTKINLRKNTGPQLKVKSEVPPQTLQYTVQTLRDIPKPLSPQNLQMV